MTQSRLGPETDRISFGPFCLSMSARLLTRDGVPVEIGGRSLDLLGALVERAGTVVPKRDLIRTVWPDVVVEDGSLRFHMAALRRLLGDGKEGARYIATQVGVGYAFVASVRSVAPEAAPAGSPGQVPLHTGRRRLPQRAERLIGRESDLRMLQDRLETDRLFTLVGPAGVGKTTLAIETGHRIPEERFGPAYFVDLGAIEDPGQIASAVAFALSIPVQTDDAVTVVLTQIRTRRLLLILDNCEHLVSAIAELAELIHQTAPEVRILATSREPLRALGEQLHWLGSLDYPEDPAALPMEALLAYPAVELFIARAAAANSALAIDLAAAREIAGLCRRLDGMALPIELTAVRVATHGLETTARLIGERFSLAWTGRRTAIARHRTLQATLDWSYDLLDEVEKRTLERLAVFLGPFSPEAALNVVAGDDIDASAAAAALDGLVAKSLVAMKGGTGHAVYRLLEMTRAHARERLIARGPGVLREAALRHARFYCTLLEEVFSGPGGTPLREERLMGQIGNIRSALGVCFGPDGDVPLGIRLAAASVPPFLQMSLLVECREWCSRALDALEPAGRGTQTELELQAALGLSLMFTRGNTAAAGVALRRGLDIAFGLGDTCAQLHLLGRLHIFHERIGDYATAWECSQRAIQVAEMMGEPEARAAASSLLGVSLFLAGNQAEARGLLERTVRLALPSEHWRTVHYGFDHRNRALITLARVCWLQGMAGRAVALADEAVAIAAGLDHPMTYCIALLWAHPVYVASGDFAKATETLDRIAVVSEDNGFGPYMAAIPGMRAGQALQEGNCGAGTAEALALIGESLARLRTARYELLTASLSIALITGLSRVGRGAEALTLTEELIERIRANGELLYMPELLRVRASLLARSGDIGPAKQVALLREALELARGQGALALQLPVAIDMAGPLQALGRGAEASDLLAEIRAAFEAVADAAGIRQADRLLQHQAREDEASAGQGRQNLVWLKLN